MKTGGGGKMFGKHEVKIKLHADALADLNFNVVWEEPFRRWKSSITASGSTRPLCFPGEKDVHKRKLTMARKRLELFLSERIRGKHAKNRSDLGENKQWIRTIEKVRSR